MRFSKQAAATALLVPALSFSLVTSHAHAQEAPAAPADVAPVPATPETPAVPAAPAAAPAAPETKVSAEARSVLDQLKAAYAELKAVTLDGKLTAHFDVAGKDRTENATFTSSFAAPNKFRHELDQGLLAGSTGDKMYIYNKTDNAYLTKTLPIAAARFKSAEFPQPQASILREQNPSLALALSEDASAELLSGIAIAEKVEDISIDGKPHPALKLTTDGTATIIAIDPSTKLIRRVSRDMKPYFEKQGVPDVKAGEITIDYTAAAPTAEAPAADQFAWTPPEGAREATADAPADAQGGDQPAMQLVGKPAPDFTLENLKGEKITLSALKGNVVVLDFWATWCGPCVASMPNLQTIAKETEADGVKVFAVNQQEDKATVEEFMKTHQFTLVALLDPEGKSGEAYKAQAIPQTVIIGKDGVVKKVLIGAGPDTEQQIRDAIAESLKG